MKRRDEGGRRRFLVRDRNSPQSTRSTVLDDDRVQGFKLSSFLLSSFEDREEEGGRGVISVASTAGRFGRGEARRNVHACERVVSSDVTDTHEGFSLWKGFVL